ncbi:unnamed protein product, partial [Cuscuta campestris]
MSNHSQNMSRGDLVAEQNKLKKELDALMKTIGEFTNSVDIPTFEGRNDPEKFLQWLKKVEHILILKDMPEGKMVKLVASRFQQNASTWWTHISTKRKFEGKPKVAIRERAKLLESVGKEKEFERRLCEGSDLMQKMLDDFQRERLEAEEAKDEKLVNDPCKAIELKHSLQPQDPQLEEVSAQKEALEPKTNTEPFNHQVPVLEDSPSSTPSQKPESTTTLARATVVMLPKSLPSQVQANIVVHEVEPTKGPDSEPPILIQEEKEEEVLPMESTDKEILYIEKPTPFIETCLHNASSEDSDQTFFDSLLDGCDYVCPKDGWSLRSWDELLVSDKEDSSMGESMVVIIEPQIDSQPVEDKEEFNLAMKANDVDQLRRLPPPPTYLESPPFILLPPSRRDEWENRKEYLIEEAKKRDTPGLVSLYRITPALWLSYRNGNEPGTSGLAKLFKKLCPKLKAYSRSSGITFGIKPHCSTSPRTKKHFPQPYPFPFLPPIDAKSTMSNESQPMSHEELVASNAALKAQVEYLAKEVAKLTKIKLNALQGSDHEDDASTSSTNKAKTNDGSDFKVDVPTFEGKNDPDEFLEWLDTVERVFDFKEVSDEKKVKIVALKFHKYASTWWTNTCTKRRRNHKEPVATWAKMKSLLKKKFLPAEYVRENFAKLQTLKQDSKSVEEYTREFEELLLRCDLQEDDEQTFVRYLFVLNLQIANTVELQSYESQEEITKLALKVEAQIKKSKALLSR